MDVEYVLSGVSFPLLLHILLLLLSLLPVPNPALDSLHSVFDSQWLKLHGDDSAQ